ncbi:FKBP-type peptidyl-prolyl cis-trans isomerase FkpA [Ferrimonas sediminum]|uniref:Peptidyl-prolyl cis-trans isomerase n=2 Tax=Ferrimonas sediminum TaxID=718193 RepID=A0A1G8Z940_9GAMM|nr:FKBP-type peptidyl-prolyl cis-trans isomerase FkpA [Ferrimonas sediminum]
MKMIAKPMMISLAVAVCFSASVVAKQEQTLNEESYAIGASLGKYLNGQIVTQKEFGLDVELEQIIQGFTDAVNGDLKLDNDALVDVLNARAKVLNEVKKERRDALVAEVAQASVDYLDENRAKQGVSVTESGLQYEVLVQGQGDKPAREDAVTVHYKGQLIDGTVFQDTHEAGEPKQVALINSIAGWEEGLQLMPIGSTYRFTIPAELAYGTEGMGVIPGGAAVVFEIELIESNKPGQAHQGMGMGMGNAGMSGMFHQK